MTTDNQIEIVKDLAKKKVTVIRIFQAPLELVWKAWTESELLDQWWAPHPWRAETKKFDFKVGGNWLYAMVGPDNSRHWSISKFTGIEKFKRYNTVVNFCDENGKLILEMPSMNWSNEFIPVKDLTKVIVEISFDKEIDFSKLLEMGFEAGFTSALSNLDQYFEAQFMLRKQNQLSGKTRTSTYLNFPGTTEEAFNFYKSVFRTEFSGKGMQRFGDIPVEAGKPPIADIIKQMILHVELPILGGHILMATDAPKEMGMTVIQGNNMHICLEPETRQETKRLFDALSNGGKIIMPLEDMFFGSYFGECTDRFGINWMFNFMENKK